MPKWNAMSNDSFLWTLVENWLLGSYLHLFYRLKTGAKATAEKKSMVTTTRVFTIIELCRKKQIIFSFII